MYIHRCTCVCMYTCICLFISHCHGVALCQHVAYYIVQQLGWRQHNFQVSTTTSTTTRDAAKRREKVRRKKKYLYEGLKKKNKHNYFISCAINQESKWVWKVAAILNNNRQCYYTIQTIKILNARPKQLLIESDCLVYLQYSTELL